MHGTRKSARRRQIAGRRLRFEALEERSLLAVASFDINLYEDVGGAPGQRITNDTVEAGQSFWVEITAQEHDPRFSGLQAVFADLAWDADVLEAVSFDPQHAVTANLPTDRGGRLNQGSPPTYPFVANGQVRQNVDSMEGLGGAAFVASRIGMPIGSDGDDTYVKQSRRGLSTTDDHFAWLQFRAEQAGEALLTMRQGGLRIVPLPVASLGSADLAFEAQMVTVVPAGQALRAAVMVDTTQTADVASVQSATTSVSTEVAAVDDQQAVAVPAIAEAPSDAATAIEQVADNRTPIAPSDASITVVTSVSWRNPVNPLDVNGADGVTPIDALVIVNYINAHPGHPALPSVRGTTALFLDVNGDALVTARDVLCVISYLDAPGRGTNVAEGEAVPRGAALPETIPQPTSASDPGTPVVTNTVAPGLSRRSARLSQMAPDPVATDAVFALAEQTAASTASDADELDGGFDFLAAAGLGLT